MKLDPNTIIPDRTGCGCSRCSYKRAKIRKERTLKWVKQNHPDVWAYWGERVESFDVGDGDCPPPVDEPTQPMKGTP